MKNTSGKCSNFGNCSLADTHVAIEVPSGLDFICHECSKPLLPKDSAAKVGKSKILAITLALLLTGGGAAWFFSNTRAAAPEPAAEAPLRATEPEKFIPAQQPAGTLTGTCSSADERSGLCRIAR